MQYYQLTIAQLAIWFAQKLDPESSAYNIGEYVEIAGAIDPGLFEAALRAASVQTDSLRLRFVDSGEGPRQYFVSDLNWILPYCDVSAESDPRAAATTWMSDDMARVSDLMQGPLYTFSLFKLSPDCFIYYQRFHHIISDGVSMSLFAQKVADLYSSLVAAKPEGLQTFGSWIEAMDDEKDYRNSPIYQQDRDYWLAQLKNRPGPVTLSGNLPVSFPCRRFFTHTACLAHSDAVALRALGKAHGLSLARMIIAAAAFYLHRFTGEQHVVVSVPVTARIDANMRNIPGMVSNTVLLRLAVEPGQSLAEFLDQVATTLSDALRHQRYRIEDLGSDFGLAATDASVHGMVVNILPGSYELSFAGCPVRLHRRIPNEPLFELSINVYDNRAVGDVRFDLNGNPLHYSKEGLALHSHRLLSFIARMAVAAPDVPLNRLTLLGAEERHTVLYEWNATELEYPRDKCVHELFEAQVADAPEAIAVVYGDRQLTYAELNAQANRLARHLRGLGVGPDTLVGICVARGPDMIVGILAIFKAGGAYVPLDPGYPKDRLAFMLADSGPMVLLVDSGFDALFAFRPDTLPVVRLDTDPPLWAGQSSDNLDCREIDLTPRHLAYVIYTSGSTGQPKGVMLEHQGLSNLVSAQLQGFNISRGSHVLQFASLSFDACLFELSMTLCRGASLYLAQAGTVLVGETLLTTVEQCAITHLGLPPAVLAALPEHARFEPVEAMIVSGETLSGVLAKRWASSLRFINGYGPTETTICASLHECSEDDPPNPPIGRPIANKRIYILDTYGEPVPIGVEGEIHIGGVGVGRGYLNRLELTAERFLDDPFVGEPGARMYKTGDLGRWLADGNIEFLGRNDFQVKIRGLRIELGEIEARLAAHPEVHEAAVLLREDGGDKRLVAYHTGKSVGADVLRTHLAAALPEYMVPAAFVRIEAFPLTPNGKLDRKALPMPEGDAFAVRAYEPPQGEAEEAVARIWAELLKVDRVGRNDHFFHLGGNSLLAVQTISRLRRVLGVEAALAGLFAHPVLADFAGSLEYALRATMQPIPRADHDGRLALSFAQQRLWLLAQIEGASEAYHIHYGVRMTGRLDREALRRALNRIVARHETLRTTFVQVAGKPEQIIASAEDSRFLLVEHDLRGHGDMENELLRLTEHEGLEPFDMALGPLVRGRLVSLADHEHVLLLTMHHIVSDGWSMGVMVYELGELYKAFQNDKADPLPLPLVQYADYAAWQRHWVDGERLREQADYWRAAMAGAPMVLELPTDRPRPVQQDYAGASVKVVLDAELAGRIKSLVRHQDSTLFMTLLAGWALLLARLSGLSEVVVGTPTANRGRTEIEGLIGFFVNTLVLRVDFGGSPTVAGLLAQVKEKSLAAQANQDIPFEQIVEIVQPPRSLAHTPLFQAMFAWQNAPQGALELPGLALSPMEPPHASSKFDLTLSLGEEGDAIVGSLEYATALFERGTIERYLGHWLTLLDAMAADDGQTVDRLTLLNGAERQNLLYDWNATEAEYPKDQCIHELFEAQVAHAPSATAVIWEGGQLSYAELNARANRLARHLRGLGVAPDARVAIFAGRGPAMVIGLLAVLKAGGAYVPLDPAYPKDRLAFMLQDSAPAALLVDSGLDTLFMELPGSLPVVRLDADPAPWEMHSAGDLGRSETGFGPGHLAYVIYTSGSTGRPKGVAMPHGVLVNLIAWQMGSTRVAGKARTLQYTPISFDVSFQELFSTWCAGGTLVLIDETTRRDPQMLLQCLDRQHVDRLFMPFIALEQLARYALAHRHFPACLREVVTAGEQLRITPEIEGFFTGLSDCRLVNQYGPSETHVVTAFTLPPACADWKALPPIGRPIANTKAYILDSQGEPTPIGVAGELYIGGAGVARGYLNSPDLTVDRFLEDPFSDEPGARMYKTGDLVRWLADKNIEFIGRNDFQVKIRGFRIELGEIEHALRQHPAVREAVVLAREDSPGDKRLVAYCVGDADPGADKLRAHVASTLPEYMVPAAYMFLDALPLTPNGKLDRKALPMPKGMGVFAAKTYEPPQGEAEEALAKIWAKLLKVERVGRYDNFFDLGGHSLLAVILLSRVELVFQANLPLATVFNCPTVAQMAELLQTKERFTPWFSLFPVQRAGSKPALFWIQGGTRNDVIKNIGTDQPVYGFIYGIGAPRGSRISFPPIDMLAAHFIEELLLVQPKGPYFLIGHSFGGLVAYEMAQQLTNRKEQVALLALVDTFLSSVSPKPLPLRNQLINLAGLMCSAPADFAKRAILTLKYFIRMFAFFLRGSTYRPESFDPEVLYPIIKDYKPKPYSGRIILFKANDSASIRKSIEPIQDRWNELVGENLVVHEIPGNHFEIIRYPGGTHIARIITQTIDEIINDGSL